MTVRHRVTKTLIVGLSGPSSSGKTTVARLLRSVFNIAASAETNHHSVTLFILHEDDFYKTDAEYASPFFLFLFLMQGGENYVALIGPPILILVFHEVP